jgi:hypothetical protein
VTLALRGTIFVLFVLEAIGFAFAWFGSTSVIEQFDRSALTTALVVGPGVATTALALRSHHHLTSRMLYGRKLTAILPCATLYAGALAMTLRPANRPLIQIVWTGGLLVAITAVFRIYREIRWIAQVRNS